MALIAKEEYLDREDLLRDSLQVTLDMEGEAICVQIEEEEEPLQEQTIEVEETYEALVNKPKKKSSITDELRDIVDQPNAINQFKRPSNAIEWIVGADYLNIPTLFKYPKQFEVVRDFFELLCPMCSSEKDLDCTDKTESELRKQVLMVYTSGRNVGIQSKIGDFACPRCGITRSKLHQLGRVKLYNELAGCAGQRSHKSSTVAFIALYILEEMLATPDLQVQLGLIPGQLLEIGFVAASALQARDTSWSEFKAAFDNSPWFQKYQEWYRMRERLTPGVRFGDLLSVTDSRVYFRDRNFQICVLSTNSGTIAGRTRVMGIIDEIARFDQTSSKISAQEVYRVIKNSLKTVRACVEDMRTRGKYVPFDGYQLTISSPMFADDEIMRLVKQAEQRSHLFAFHKSTWEMIPEMPKTSFEEDLRVDPVGTMRDFGALPPGAEDPLIPNFEYFKSQVVSKMLPTIIADCVFFEERSLTGDVFKYVGPVIKKALSDKWNPRYIHCDAGEVECSFGISVGHGQKVGEETMTVIDAIIEVRPDRGGKVEVNFDSVLKFITGLQKYFSLSGISYDRWNSTAHLQKLRQGFKVDKHNIANLDYENFHVHGNRGLIKLPQPEIDLKIFRPEMIDVPIAKALWEAEGLRRKGGRIERSPKRTSDLVQCVIGVHRWVQMAASGEEVDGKVVMMGGRRVSTFRSLSREQRPGSVIRFRR